MCGIFGAVGAVDRLPVDAAVRISTALAHRGPDAEGHYADPACVFVHRRLKIIDLSPAGAQPMAGSSPDVQVCFNGEIYTHHALRTELEAHGQKFVSRSDTEAIVHGYEVWGDAVVDKLVGMFAFMVWDRRQKRALVARDRVGKKPLYYHFDRGVLRAASTVAALHASGVPAGINEQALPFYLAYGFVPPPTTLHAGVQQLAPGQLMTLTVGTDGAIAGDPTIRTYYEPRFGEPAGSPPRDYAIARSEVRRLVEEAVERRLVSDVPLGAFLSGGIDSTIVVGVMAKRLKRVRTFCIGFAGDARYDETQFARTASQAFGTDHTEFTLEPSSFELVETLVRHHDGPFGDSSAIPTYVVSQLTKQHVTVALTGDGGDELFCGYERFLAAETSERVPLAARQLAARAADLLPAAGSDRSLLGKARRFFSATALPLADRLARWNSFFPDPVAMLRPEIAARLDGNAPLDWQRNMLARCSGQSAMARILEHNFRTYLPFDLLIKADRCSMAHGLELRSPFLDDALVGYAAQLPADYLRQGLRTKRILRDAFADLLPPTINSRGKMGFGVPLGTWFRGSLRSYLVDHLGPRAALGEYLDTARVQTLLDEHQSGRVDHGQKLWALLTLEIWLRSLRSSTAGAART